MRLKCEVFDKKKESLFMKKKERKNHCDEKLKKN